LLLFGRNFGILTLQILFEVNEVENEDVDHPDFGTVDGLRWTKRMADDARK
jgi:hypothetical protein